MKQLYYYVFTFIAAAVILASCGKDGAVGPTGPAGSTGAAGAVGPAGPAGADGKNGSVIYSGTTVPATTLGAVGDFYINLSTSLLYGPKTTAGWGSGLSLKGATGPAGATGSTGAAGTPGSKIYSGATAPTATQGIAGDYYLDVTNFLLYGPKTGTGWGTPIGLQGPAGPQGPEGNANVKVDTFTVKGDQWRAGALYGLEATGQTRVTTNVMSYERLNNTVTPDVLNNGLVLVYFTPIFDYNPLVWVPLPYEFPDQELGYSYNFAYVTIEGTVGLDYWFAATSSSATLPDLNTYVPPSYEFKIVTVTGQAGTFMTAHHVNLKNYNEVSRVLGLWQHDKAK